MKRQNWKQNKQNKKEISTNVLNLFNVYICKKIKKLCPKGLEPRHILQIPSVLESILADEIEPTIKMNSDRPSNWNFDEKKITTC